MQHLVFTGMCLIGKLSRDEVLTDSKVYLKLYAHSDCVCSPCSYCHMQQLCKTSDLTFQSKAWSVYECLLNVSPARLRPLHKRMCSLQRPCIMRRPATSVRLQESNRSARGCTDRSGSGTLWHRSGSKPRLHAPKHRKYSRSRRVLPAVQRRLEAST